MTPRSSCPGGESTPLQGANLRLNYEINNVTDTALGNLGAEDTIVLPVWPGPQLQTAWVTFGKQRRVNSGARRSGERGLSISRPTPYRGYQAGGGVRFLKPP